jgi:hypothetical protein
MNEWQAREDWVGSNFGFIEQLPWNLPKGIRENHEFILLGWRLSLHRTLWPVVRADVTWSAGDVTARAMGGCVVICTRGRLLCWRSRNNEQFLRLQLYLRHSAGLQKPRTVISTAARTSDFSVTLAVLCAMSWTKPVSKVAFGSIRRSFTVSLAKYVCFFKVT